MGDVEKMRRRPVMEDLEVFHDAEELPSKEESRRFFEDLVVNQAAKPPASKTNAAHRTLEVLPVAPPPKPQQLTEEERRQLEKQEEDTLRELRLFLRDVTQRLAVDRRFRAFTKPVDTEEVPDYDTVIKQPMDLSTVLSKIDSHQYLTAGDFLRDIDLICSNALKYNPDKDPGDRLIRHRACTLKDTAYAIVREEMNEDFEHRCKEIKESHQKRERSTRKRRRNEGSSDIATKKRKFQFNEEHKAPEDQNEVEIDEESAEKDVSNTDCTEDSWAHHMSHARRSQGEEQQAISIENATEILTQPVTVDHDELKYLLDFVTVMTRNFNIFHLEKLYAILSQCIYRHWEDHDKTELVKEMKKKIAAFVYAQ